MTRHHRARTFKIPGPWINFKLFSKPVSCVAHYFCEFCKKRLILFLSFCTIRVLIALSYFLTVIHTFSDSRARLCPNGFKLFLASLVMSRKNIRLEWFGRGNINDIETLPLPAIPSRIRQFLINGLNNKLRRLKGLQFATLSHWYT